MQLGPRAPRLVVILGFDGAQLLDLAGPLQVFATACDLARRAGSPAAPGDSPYETVLASMRGGLVRTSAGVYLETRALRALERQKIDTVIVAGGEGAAGALNDKALLRWVARSGPRARRLCSVCTGAFVLAEAGLLAGRRAVTHWKSCARLATSYPAVRVDPDPIFIRDGAVWTSAGITAGIDLALALVEEDLGRAAAMAVARHLVVFLKRPGGQAQFSAPLEAQIASAESALEQRFAALHGWIADNLAGDLSVGRLARKVGMSARSFARAYRSATGTTPGKAVEAMRVEAARRALESEGEPVKTVAAACGFGDDERMRRAFHRRLKVNPQQYRARFAWVGRARVAQAPA